MTWKSEIRMATVDLVVKSSSAVDGAEHEDKAQLKIRKAEQLSHQVAGHKHGIDKVGILQDCDGTVLKQLQPPPRGQCELHFYTQVFSQQCTDPQILALQQHLPKYYGTWVSLEKPNELYLKLEDVTRTFLQPCIMDVKMGRKNYDPFASEQKREKQIKKYPLMEEIGFLILGMRVYEVTSGSYICHEKHYGHSLTKDTLKTGLARFFHNGKELRKDAISLSIHKIYNILHWFESQKQLHFYASSLLFVYEGSPHLANAHKQSEIQTRQEHRQTEPEKDNYINIPHSKFLDRNCSIATSKTSQGKINCTDLPQDIHHVRQVNEIRSQSLHQNSDQANGERAESERMTAGDGKSTGFSGERSDSERKDDVEVRMIDFAHVFPSDSPDEGYIHGLRNLLFLLEQILQD
ncbi:inositol polyphosphate multikinase [Trichomycterus rosablanca]|uniref:inositol polyphosphate multikinase n=1 Tax=Trichomycterus rosablanca TaxID=2290929 RepID=UPI002F357659